MAKEMLFEQILRAKLGIEEKNHSQTPPQKGPTSYNIPPSVHFFTAQFSWTPKKITKVYKKKRVEKPEVKIEIKVKESPPPPLAPENFLSISEWSESEQKVFMGFVALGAQVNEKQFTEKQIKKEYRRLAKKLHPDLASSETSSRQFQALKQTYEKLCKKIKSLAHPPV